MKKILSILSLIACLALSACEDDQFVMNYQVVNNNAIILRMTGYGSISIKNLTNANISYDNMAQWFKEAIHQNIEKDQIVIGTLSATYYALNDYHPNERCDIAIKYIQRDGQRCEMHIYREFNKYTVHSRSYYAQ